MAPTLVYLMRARARASKSPPSHLHLVISARIKKKLSDKPMMPSQREASVRLDPVMAKSSSPAFRLIMDRACATRCRSTIGLNDPET
jgi:hypothetical protein